MWESKPYTPKALSLPPMRKDCTWASSKNAGGLRPIHLSRGFKLRRRQKHRSRGYEPRISMVERGGGLDLTCNHISWDKKSALI